MDISESIKTLIGQNTQFLNNLLRGRPVERAQRVSFAIILILIGFMGLFFT